MNTINRYKAVAVNNLTIARFEKIYLATIPLTIVEQTHQVSAVMVFFPRQYQPFHLGSYLQINQPCFYHVTEGMTEIKLITQNKEWSCAYLQYYPKPFS